MMPLDLYSEPFARTGNIAAEGFRKLLGRPALGLLQTVIREALQNSIDAAHSGQAPRILLRSRVLDPDQMAFLSTVVLASTGGENGLDPLSDIINAGPLRVFEIADFGTTGLGGPTRADAPSDEAEDPDFVNFLRNVGAARDTFQGGGTYGYGKTSLYSLSDCATILVDSETTFAGLPVRRFMGCRLGDAFNASGPDGRRRYTGRHWWGRADGEGGVDPVEGPDAASIAESLGMPERDRSGTGTTIMILCPQIDNDCDLGLELIETVLWNFWPRMCNTTPAERKLSIRIEVDGTELTLPAPEQFPPLDLFASALNDARSGKDCSLISSQRPQMELGQLAIRKGLCTSRHPAALRPESRVPRQSAHIALMRPVELVVKYVEGEAFSDHRFEWAGVFICSGEEEVEAAFADAEPPAHDDWIPDMLPKGRKKTFVNVALKRLTDAARTFANPLQAGAASGERGPSLASTATTMGRMLDSSSGRGPARKRSSSGGGKRKSVSISRPRFLGLEMHEGVPTAVFEADFVNGTSSTDLRLRAEPYLVIDGAASSSEDLPFEYDARVSMISLGKEASAGPVLAPGDAQGRVLCHVPVPSEGAIGLKLHIEGEVG